RVCAVPPHPASYSLSLHDALPIFASLLGGAVITETLFARQGVGRLMLEATTSKDIPVVLGITLLAAFIYVVVNLLVDLLNALIEDRKSTRLNSSHVKSSYAVFCLK